MDSCAAQALSCADRQRIVSLRDYRLVAMKFAKVLPSVASSKRAGLWRRHLKGSLIAPLGLAKIFQIFALDAFHLRRCVLASIILRFFVTV